MKTRVLYVIDGLEFGGGERVFSQIINGLPEDRYEAFLAAAPNEIFRNIVTAPNRTFYPIDFSQRYNLGNIIRLIQIIKDQQIDIVHGQGARAEFYARLAGAMAGKRYVSTVAMPVEGYDVGRKKKFFYRALDRLTERNVDRFIVVSSVLQNTMVRGHKVPSKRVVKIYNGIETKKYNPRALEEAGGEIRREFSAGVDTTLIGACGRLVWQKGFEYFLRAIPEILLSMPKTRFVVVGSGPLRSELEKMAHDLTIQDDVVFTGYRNDIRDMLAALDIVVIPSVLEGFPMITLEAMAMEKPIVATAIDGITEQIENGKEGLLIPPRNPAEIARGVVRLAKNTAESRLLGMNARSRVLRDFTVEKMIEETIKVYEGL